MKHIKTGWLWACIIVYCTDKKWPGAFPPELSIGLCHEPNAKLTVPADTLFYCRIILRSFFTKYNIQKLNLFSKMDISKTVWINSCLYIIFFKHFISFFIFFLSKRIHIMWEIDSITRKCRVNNIPYGSLIILFWFTISKACSSLNLLLYVLSHYLLLYVLSHSDNKVD